MSNEHQYTSDALGPPLIFSFYTPTYSYILLLFKSIQIYSTCSRDRPWLSFAREAVESWPSVESARQAARGLTSQCDMRWHAVTESLAGTVALSWCGFLKIKVGIYKYSIAGTACDTRWDMSLSLRPGICGSTKSSIARLCQCCTTSTCLIMFTEFPGITVICAVEVKSS